MWDGRRWSGVPIDVNASLGADTVTQTMLGCLNIVGLPSVGEAMRGRLARLVDAYRQRIEEDFATLASRFSQRTV